MNKVKLILVVVVISTLFLCGIYLRLEDLLFVDKTDQMEMQIKSQVSSLVLAYQADAKFLLKWVQTFNEEGTKRINWTAMNPYFAVAQLNSQLQVVEWSFREKSPVSNLSRENLSQLISSFKVKGGEKDIKYLVYTDPEKKKIFLTLIPQREKVWVFASLGENLQSIMDSQKASPYMLTLINSDLLSLANIKSEYIGQKIFENKIVGELKNSKKATSSGTFSISSGEEFFAFFEKIPDIDLYIYSQASLSDMVNFRNSLKNQFLLFSIGFLIILVAVMMIVQDPLGKKLVVTGPKGQPHGEGETFNKMNSGAKDLADVKSTTTMSESKEENDKAKLEGYMRVASALGHELRAPIIKSLNLTTTLLAESAVSDEKEDVKKIQSEMRSAKDTIDKLLTFAGDKPTEKIEAKVDTAILRALKSLETLLHLKSVRVVKDMADTRNLSIDVNKLATVVENIIKNSVQAMERKIGKQIHLKSYQNEKSVMIEITDNGDGIDNGNLNRIFEPFFTTLSFNKNVGLGLSIAQGIINEHDGKIKVESEKGKGTKVLIELPLAVNQASILREGPQADNAEVSNLNLRTLNIPKLSEDDFKLSEELKNEDTDKDLMPSAKNEKIDLKKNEVVSEVIKSSENNNEVSNSMESSEKSPTAPNLDINIDELFEMNEATVVENVVVPLKPVPAPENKVELVQPPKKNAKVPDKKDSDNFQVVIRKPKGRG